MWDLATQHEAADESLAAIDASVSRRELESALAAKQAAIEELEASRSLLRSFQENSPHHAYIKNAAGVYLRYNRAFASFYDVDQELWVGKTAHEVLPQPVDTAFSEQESVVLTTGKTAESLFRITLPGRGDFVLRSIKFAVESTHGERLIGGMDMDVTEEIRQREELEDANRKLEQLARTDALTGLYSRGTFDDRMDREYAITERKSRSLALLVLDVDDFKFRNDTFGHAAGDDALRTVGRVLRHLVRAGEVAARLGGEEFGIMLPETSLMEACSLAHRVQVALANEQCASGLIRVSIGVAEKGPGIHSWSDLLAKADMAMYEAKRRGKDRVVRLVQGAFIQLPSLVD